MAGENRKQRHDLRYLFMRGLIDHEKNQRSRHYLKSAAECTSRAVVSLELSPGPITTVKHAKRLTGIGGETCIRLAKLDEARDFSSLKPLGGRFVSSAGAILVAMLEMNHQRMIQEDNNGKDILIPENQVKIRALSLCEEPFIEDGNEGFCIAWWRLEVLIKRELIKRRSQKKAAVLQLLPAGKDIAQRLAGSDFLLNIKSIRQNTETIADSTHDDTLGRNSLPNPPIDQIKQDSLFTNDTGKEGVVLLVDTQEMGGERAGLGELCRLFEQNGVCYRTKKLATGDYGWIWRKGNTEIRLPCLAERKRADDIPRTLKEGRFWSQINKMLEWKAGFTDRGMDCHIHYILERKPEEYVVKCTDGCQGIGRCGNPTLAQIKAVIEDLKHHPELLVKETGSLEITAVLLKSLTAELIERTNKGDFQTLLCDTPQQNNSKVKLENVNTDTDIGYIQNDSEIELNYEEQLQMALVNSLIDVKGQHSDSGSGRYTVTNEESRLSGKNESDKQTQLLNDRSEFEDTRFNNVLSELTLPESPLMQYHCTVESSVTCQGPSGDFKENSGKCGNEYRPKINKKRRCVTSLSPEQSTSYPNSDHHSSNLNSSKKARKAADESNLVTGMVDFDCVKKMDRKQENCDLDILVVRDQKDVDTDEILKSLRSSYQTNSVSQSAPEIKSFINDDFEEKREQKLKSKWKPIKLNLSPSKCFIESNVVRVTSDSCIKKGRRKINKHVKRESLHEYDTVTRSLQNITNDEPIHQETESGKKELVNNSSLSTDRSHIESTCGPQMDKSFDKDIGRTKVNEDNESNKSIEDIFADTSSQKGAICSTSAIPDKNDDSVNFLENEKVSRWLARSCETDTQTDTTETVRDEGPSSHTVKEDSDDDLPDILPVIAPEDNKDSTNNCIVVIEDDITFSDPGPSSKKNVAKSWKTKKKGRHGHDSGYDSGDIRRTKPGYSICEPDDFSVGTCVMGIDNEDINAKIDTILAILPHVRRNRVKRALLTCGHDVEQSVSLLLDTGSDTGRPAEMVIDLTD